MKTDNIRRNPAQVWCVIGYQRVLPDIHPTKRAMSGAQQWILEMTLSKLSLAASLSGVLVLSACADFNDPNNPNRNTQQGAAIGAGLGALVGLAAGDNADERRRGAVVGAIVGGVIGGLVLF